MRILVVIFILKIFLSTNIENIILLETGFMKVEHIKK